MTNSQQLLKDLKTQLGRLQDDLRQRVEDQPEFDQALRAEYAAATRARRTADTFETWREDPITQAGVAWVLGTVFVRFLEDNGLIEPRLSGVGDHRRFALDRHAAYGLQHPLETDREYLLHVFQEVGELPAGREVFDERHNPLWLLTPSGDAAKNLVEFWQRIDPGTGAIAHDLTDPAWDTRLLGDLYQDLSEAARKKYALLQTPRFVEAFILDRTLTPAIETFGYRDTTLIDPTCGSGHFLLGAFGRLLKLYQEHEPALNERERVRRVLAQIAGVDVNPFAAAIARFRLLIAALQACQITRLRDAPGFEINVTTGDSLLHGRRFAEERAVQVALDPDDPSHHHFATEDESVDRILGHQYHAVVGNPPYITVKDRALNDLYRQRYGSCHGQYSLVVPFVERFFELAICPTEALGVGFVGMIVANSFMRREFGRKLIEEYLERVDLSHVVDTERAYIPGHKTHTAILFGRNRRTGPGSAVRLVMGLRREKGRPEDPAKGLVWLAILNQIDIAGSETAFITVRDVEQSQLHTHPWSIGGGGASELKAAMDENAKRVLAAIPGIDIGFMTITGEDNCLLVPMRLANRRSLLSRSLGEGDGIRDWTCRSADVVVWPNDEFGNRLPEKLLTVHLRFCWPFRTSLRARKLFGIPVETQGVPWWALREVYRQRFGSEHTIAFAEVATHNHFVLEGPARVFTQTAPVIKLASSSTTDEHYELIGLLNSAAACFWLKQICQRKGGTGLGGGIYDEEWEFFYQMNVTKVAQFPVPLRLPLALGEALTVLGRELFGLTTKVAQTQSSSALLRDRYHTVLTELIGQQEELDWQVYRDYGLTDGALVLDREPPPLRLGDRAFEIVMARQVAAGDLETTWFERHGATPITEFPETWPDDYKRVVERRIELIGTDRFIGLIEQPEFKRRWNTEPWETQEERARRDWLLDRLETSFYWSNAPALTTTAKLADRARQDTELMQVAELFRGRADFDVTTLVTELITPEAVPYLSVLRYNDAGLRKRIQWERTWDLQRREDAIDARMDLPDGDPLKLTKADATREKLAQVGDIAVPPKYTSVDFKKGDYWRLRGKLDVLKERFVIYPGAERSVDPTPVVGWAGWDHLHQAQALADYYIRMLEQEGWGADRLTPLLAGLLELVPWLKQWHNDLDPHYNLRMGDYFDEFVQTQAKALNLTADQVRAWSPPVDVKGSARRNRKGAVKELKADLQAADVRE